MHTFMIFTAVALIFQYSDGPNVKIVLNIPQKMNLLVIRLQFSFLE